MKAVKILKNSLFPLFCFLVMQVLSFIIVDNSRVYLNDSPYAEQNVISVVFTSVIYNFFVFSTYLLLFCVYFTKFQVDKSQLIKTAIADYLWLMLAEAVKMAVCSVVQKNHFLIFFCINAVYIVGIQLILIFVFKKQIKKSALHIKQLNVIIIMLLLALIAVGTVMLYRFNLKITELSAYTEKAEDYINSIIFKENIRILFITVLFQTFCFMILLNRFQCEVAAPRVVLSFITVLFSLGICALKLIAPAGMICRINKSSDYSSKINQEEFYIDRSEMTVFRETDGGESPVYYSQSIEIYFGENKVCQTNSNYAYEKDDIENSEIDGYKILVIKNILAAFVDENGNTGYILADGEMSGKCMADFLDYNWVEKPYET